MQMITNSCNAISLCFRTQKALMFISYSDNMWGTFCKVSVELSASRYFRQWARVEHRSLLFERIILALSSLSDCNDNFDEHELNAAAHIFMRTLKALYSNTNASYSNQAFVNPGNPGSLGQRIAGEGIPTTQANRGITTILCPTPAASTPHRHGKGIACSATSSSSKPR